jgi:hypothetical protein
VAPAVGDHLFMHARPVFEAGGKSDLHVPVQVGRDRDDQLGDPLVRLGVVALTEWPDGSSS